MTAIATATENGMTVAGSADLVVLSASALHKLLVGSDRYRCAFCPDEHTLAVVAEVDAAGNDQGVVVVRHEGEAWALARYLLVEAFAAVDGGTWEAMRAMAEIDTGGAMN